jgi:hypothetical protein
MLALDFGTVLYGVAQLAGLDRDNLPDHFFKQVRDLANRRLAIAYPSAAWPELVRVAALTTATADKFTLTSGMGEIIEVYDKDPLLNIDAVPQTYRLYDDGTRYIYTRGSKKTVYVEYRKARADLTGDVYVEASYPPNSQVYSSKNFYTANTGTDGNGFVDTEWDKVEIPTRFLGYLTQGIFTDYLTANGTPAEMEEQKAEGLLSLELDSLIREEGQVRKVKVTTY